MGQPQLSLLFICFATTYPCCPGGGLNTLSTASLPVAVRKTGGALCHVRMLLPAGKLTRVYFRRHHWKVWKFEIQTGQVWSAKRVYLGRSISKQRRQKGKLHRNKLVVLVNMFTLQNPPPCMRSIKKNIMNIFKTRKLMLNLHNFYPI